MLLSKQELRQQYHPKKLPKKETRINTINHLLKNKMDEDEQIARFEAKAAEEFSKHGKEQMTARYLGGTLYGLGSELATLRCYKVYKGSPEINQVFSKNLGQFYFSYSVNWAPN